MKPLRLYQIPWSHYCDKVRWALDFKQISYELITFNPFGKTKGLERAPKTMRKLTPILEDPNNQDENSFQSDSTPILLYLNDRYSQSSKALFPSSTDGKRQQVIDTCLRLDSELGLYVRRLAYVQLIKEKPSAMSILLGEQFSWAYNPDDIRSRLISSFVTAPMIARFRLHRIREEQIREKTEQLLLDIGDHLCVNDYLVGQQFTAADLTLCSLVKPLQMVPCFRDDSRFQTIFNYHERIRRNYDPKYPNIYTAVEKLANEHRIKTKQNENLLITRVRTFIRRINFIQRIFFMFMTMFVKRVYGPESDNEETLQFQRLPSSDKQEKEAFNDQRRVITKSTWSKIKLLFKYQCHLFFTMPSQTAHLDTKSKFSSSDTR